MTELAPLTGTPKQVAWAEAIRADLLEKESIYSARADRQIKDGQLPELVKAEALPWLVACRRLAAWASKQTSAARLIDVKTKLRQNPESLALDFAPQFDGDEDQTEADIGSFAFQLRAELRDQKGV